MDCSHQNYIAAFIGGGRMVQTMNWEKASLLCIEYRTGTLQVYNYSSRVDIVLLVN
jgi:hypothetical protein